MKIQNRQVPQVTSETLWMARDELPLEDPVFYARIRERMTLAHGAELIDTMADIIEQGDVLSATLSWYNNIAMIVYGDPACTIDDILRCNPGLFNLVSEKIRFFSKGPQREICWEKSMLILYACIEAESMSIKALELLSDLGKKVP